jgi:uncharacterized phiE125 gp8 family phage protein
MKYFVSESPTVAPVSVDDLKAHLFLFDDDSYDAELQYTLLSAQDVVSDLLGEHLSSTIVQCNLSSVEDTVLPHQKVLGISGVKYYDTTDTLVDLNTSEYFLDNTGTDVKIKFASKPAVSSKYENPVSVSYEAGLLVIPHVLAQAVLIIAAELFEVRSETVTVQRYKAMGVATTLLFKHRRW